MSKEGVVTAVTSEITGAVVSVEVDEELLFLLQEMMVRLKSDMSIMYKTLIIFHSPVVKINNL